jgi:hypothetical protein
MVRRFRSPASKRRIRAARPGLGLHGAAVARPEPARTATRNSGTALAAAAAGLRNARGEPRLNGGTGHRPRFGFDRRRGGTGATETQFMTERGKRLLLVAGSMSLALVVAEVGVRTTDVIRGHRFFGGHRNRIANARPLVPFRTFGLVPYRDVDGVRWIASRHGELFPLRKIPGTTRIVVFGGSTTENTFVMEHQGVHYPRALQQRLRQDTGNEAIEVISVANSAYATPHSLILLELDVLDWDPDIVILSHNVNDLLAAYFPGNAFNYANKYGTEFYGLPNVRSLYSLPNVLLQHSELYWALQSRLDRVVRAHDPSYAIHRVSYGMEPPADAREAFRRNLVSFVRLAKGAGIEVLLGTQPLEPSEESFVRHMAFKPYNDIVQYPLHEEFLAHHAAYNQVVREVATAEGAFLVDNAARFAGHRERFIDFVHYNLEGVEALAANFEAALRDRVDGGPPRTVARR